MSVSEAQKKAKKKWEAINYDMLGVRVKKGERDRIKSFAENRGMSLNSFAKEAIYASMGESDKS